MGSATNRPQPFTPSTLDFWAGKNALLVEGLGILHELLDGIDDTIGLMLGLIGLQQHCYQILERAHEGRALIG